MCRTARSWRSIRADILLFRDGAVRANAGTTAGVGHRSANDVAAVTPLAFGLYWKRATTQGAAAAMFLGLATWLGLEFAAPEAVLPPQFAGLIAAVCGMIAGSLLPQWYAGTAHAGRRAGFAHHAKS